MAHAENHLLKVKKSYVLNKNIKIKYTRVLYFTYYIPIQIFLNIGYLFRKIHLGIESFDIKVKYSLVSPRKDDK